MGTLPNEALDNLVFLLLPKRASASTDLSFATLVPEVSATRASIGVGGGRVNCIGGAFRCQAV